MSGVGRVADRLGEFATSMIGNAAGATVDPKAGLQKLSGAALSPAVLVSGGLAVVAYVLGRRTRA